MSVEQKLFSLCEDFINILHYLKEKNRITEEEFNIMVEHKMKFIEKFLN